MNADLIRTWTPILNALPDSQRERARQLIEQHGETQPTGFIVELLELFGVHAAYLQTLPDQMAKAGERARTQMESTLGTATELHERTRLELEEIVSSVARTGAGFTIALEQATGAQVAAVQQAADRLDATIQREFEKQNLPVLAHHLKDVQEKSGATLKAALWLHQEAEHIEEHAEERLRSLERRCHESFERLEQFNWRGAWTVCGSVCLMLLVLIASLLHLHLRSRAETELVRKIATASAMMEQNRKAFAELAVAGVALKVNRSADAATGRPIPGGFAIIVENALVAEIRDYEKGKAAFIFVNSGRREGEIHRLQFKVADGLQK